MSDDQAGVASAEDSGGGFDVVLRGYDRRQVEDYIARVELTLASAGAQQAQEAERLRVLEDQVLALQSAVADAERRAEGRPEPLSLVGERIATLLRLAEEEAEEVVLDARGRADRELAHRIADLERREADVAGASVEADRIRMEAQNDAKAARDKARSDAEDLLRRARAESEQLLASAAQEGEQRRRTADEDVAILHEESRRLALELEDEARRQGQALVDDAHRHAQEIVDGAEHDVADLAFQRDTIAAQLADLRRALAEATRPLDLQ